MSPLPFATLPPLATGNADFEAMVAALKNADMGLILDFVPNHMGIAGMINQWWRDVLEFGPQSRYASFFDIQWTADFSRSHPQVLVPLLGDHYGRVLERGRKEVLRAQAVVAGQRREQPRECVQAAGRRAHDDQIVERKLGLGLQAQLARDFGHRWIFEERTIREHHKRQR